MTNKPLVVCPVPCLVYNFIISYRDIRVVITKRLECISMTGLIINTIMNVITIKQGRNGCTHLHAVFTEEPHLGINNFLRGAEMVRIVPIQAPRNYTADIILRKGSRRDSSLPVLVQKTEIEADYPYLTRELGEQLGKKTNFVAAAVAALGLKGNPRYHQAIRASSSGSIQRYSPATLEKLRSHLRDNPEFNPYRLRKENSS